MKIVDFFAQDENKKLYQEWVTDPRTKLVMEMATTELVRPTGMAKPTGEEALYLHGMIVGMTRMLDAIMNLEKLDPRSPENLAAQKEVEATFGAEAFLRREGYLPPAVSSINAKE